MEALPEVLIRMNDEVAQQVPYRLWWLRDRLPEYGVFGHQGSVGYEVR